MTQQNKIGNSDKSQTAVEWLVNELKSYAFHERIDMAEWEELKKLSRKAKQMEKEQIIYAHLTGLIHPLETEATKQAEQYYNETYKP